MKYLFLDKLTQNFSELLNDNEGYNVIIEVGNEPNKKTFAAHSAILRYRSSYFNKELKNTVPNINNSIKTITIQNIPAQVFEIILKYIYYGIMDTENIDERTIYDLMIIANKFELEELSMKLESHLIEFEASWLKTHFSFVYHSIFKNNKFENLKKCCNDIIARYPKFIFESTEFTSFSESVLVSILERDDLQMKESVIWDYLIKWGTAQIPTLPEKLERWTDENFMTLKSTLQQCLPLIRYFHISNPDVLDKIKPYKKILDKQLWNDLKQHLILPYRPILSIILPPRVYIKQELPSRINLAPEPPPRMYIPPRINLAPEPPPRVYIKQELPSRINLAPEPPPRMYIPPRINLAPEPPPRVNEPFSTIINEGHAAIISSWINNKPTSYSLTKIPYEFKLILRGSKDGFAPRTFWDICHGHVNTIVISKVKETGEIIGGFNPLFWDKTRSDWIKTNKSFIFSFQDGSSQNPILSRVKDENYAIFCHCHKNKVGPRFGKAEFMLKSCESDFTQDCLNQCKESKYYQKSLRKKSVAHTFSIIDYEVLKVVKKI
ncbi:hypothetical protein Glove_230g213 [Diversispora epigaea]|uniref:BTB domain-containing protein n=1 Tax=Diversispora epigaea TaxID=1348612 RepID=A0A397ICD8_9GLOM|nr:hypothetical protein Glove_230g213 [Diversispora epigaea]